MGNFTEEERKQYKQCGNVNSSEGQRVCRVSLTTKNLNSKEEVHRMYVCNSENVSVGIKKNVFSSKKGYIKNNHKKNNKEVRELYIKQKW